MSIRTEKEQAVADIQQKLAQAQVVILTDYRGLNVSEATKLRSKLREAGVEYKVLKNTLIRIAAHNMGQEGLDTYLEGPTAVAFDYNDPVAPAKILADFMKETKKLEIKAGLLQGKVIDNNAVKALAELPSREVLIAKALGSMQAPLYGLANVLQGNIRNLAYALEAVRQQKEATP